MQPYLALLCRVRHGAAFDCLVDGEDEACEASVRWGALEGRDVLRGCDASRGRHERRHVQRKMQVEVEVEVEVDGPSGTVARDHATPIVR